MKTEGRKSKNNFMFMEKKKKNDRVREVRFEKAESSADRRCQAL